jgi:hypothetical protein
MHVYEEKGQAKDKVEVATALGVVEQEAKGWYEKVVAKFDAHRPQVIYARILESDELVV